MLASLLQSGIGPIIAEHGEAAINLTVIWVPVMLVMAFFTVAKLGGRPELILIMLAAVAGTLYVFGGDATWFSGILSFIPR